MRFKSILFLASIFGYIRVREPIPLHKRLRKSQSSETETTFIIDEG
jgi:hypothetical protein